MSRRLTLSQLAALAKADSKTVTPECNKEIRRFAQVGVGLMKKQIQSMHAVDTSTMLNSVSAESVGTTAATIGPTVDYAAYVALGTSRVAARPFHIAAARDLQKQVKDFEIKLEL